MVTMLLGLCKLLLSLNGSHLSQGLVQSMKHVKMSANQLNLGLILLEQPL